MQKAFQKAKRNLKLKNNVLLDFFAKNTKFFTFLKRKSSNNNERHQRLSTIYTSTVFLLRVGQFGKFPTCQFGELIKSDNVAIFLRGVKGAKQLSRQSGEFIF